MSAFLPEDGVGSKDTNMVLDYILLNIIQQKRKNNKVCILWSDCGGHQARLVLSRYTQFACLILTLHLDLLVTPLQPCKD